MPTDEDDLMPNDDALAIAASRLDARGKELVEARVSRLRASAEGGRFSEAELRDVLHGAVDRAVAALRSPDASAAERGGPSPAAPHTRPVIPAAVADSLRAHLSSMRDTFLEDATAAGLDQETILRGVRRLWDVADHYAVARQATALTPGPEHQGRRADFLRSLVLGSLDDAAVRDTAAVLGLHPDADFWVFRCRQLDHSAGDLASQLRAQDAASAAQTVLAEVDEDLAGLSTARPSPLEGSIIAVAGPTDLLAAPGAFAEASRVLRVASRYGRPGIVDRSALSVRMAVEQEPRLGSTLQQKFVASLASQGAAGRDILATVRTWIGQRRSIPTTARLLSVHENTIRYRLARFTELTGADLADTDVLVEVWWALEYDTLHGGHDGATGSGSGRPSPRGR